MYGILSQIILKEFILEVNDKCIHLHICILTPLKLSHLKAMFYIVFKVKDIYIFFSWNLISKFEFINSGYVNQIRTFKIDIKSEILNHYIS